METHGVAIAPPAFDDHLGFAQAINDLPVERLVAQAGIEAFDIAILPGASGRDVGGLGPDGGDPVLDSMCDELGAAVHWE